MKTIKAITKTVGGFVLDILIAVQLSPKPGAMLIHKLFDHLETITDPATYNAAKEKVVVELDVEYTSHYKENTYDLYVPKETENAVPVLFWVHGGGFVGGDKRDAREFATRLAADAHLAIVSINYQLAPASQYPSQLRQLDEVVQHIQQSCSSRPQIDMDRVFLGGDSAGAQIALQYANVQTNTRYAQQMGFKPMISKEQLKGTLSYCGPVDLKQQITKPSDSRFMKFFIQTVAWSLIGTKNWRDSQEIQEASVESYVTTDFPPTYITDGNTFSFPEQGLSLAQKLEALEVPVETLFYTDSDKQIVHEYQFDFSTPEAKESYARTVKFIKTHQ